MLRHSNQNQATAPSLAVTMLLSTPGGMFSNGHFGLYPNPPLTPPQFEILKRRVDILLKEYGME